MGILEKFKGLFSKKSVVRENYNAPSDRFSTQTDLVAYLVERIGPEGWATFEVSENCQNFVIKVTGESIITCTEEVDLPSIARSKVGWNREPRDTLDAFKLSAILLVLRVQRGCKQPPIVKHGQPRLPRRPHARPRRQRGTALDVADGLLGFYAADSSIRRRRHRQS